MLSKNQTIGVVCGIVLPTILVVIILIAFFQWRRTARKHVEDYYTPPKELVIPPNFSYQASDEGIRKRAWLLTESARLTFSGAKLKKGSIDTASIVATIDAFGPIYQQEPSKKLVKLMKSEENRDLAFSHFIVTTLVSSILPDQKQRVSLLDPMVLSLYHHCRCPETFIRMFDAPECFLDQLTMAKVQVTNVIRVFYAQRSAALCHGPTRDKLKWN